MATASGTKAMSCREQGCRRATAHPSRTCRDHRVQPDLTRAPVGPDGLRPYQVGAIYGDEMNRTRARAMPDADQAAAMAAAWSGAPIPMQVLLDENGLLGDRERPALLRPSMDERAWYERGQLHRGDGPAREWTRVGASDQQWYHRGELVSNGADPRPGQLVAAGAPPSHLSALLWFSRAEVGAAEDDGSLVPRSGHELAMALAREGEAVDLDLLEAVAGAELAEPGVALAVATGALPLSWAVAGA